MNSKSSQNAEKEQTRGKKEQRGEIKCAQERLWDAFGRFRGETFDFSGLGGGPKIGCTGTPNYYKALGFGGISSKSMGVT